MTSHNIPYDILYIKFCKIHMESHNNMYEILHIKFCIIYTVSHNILYDILYIKFCTIHIITVLRRERQESKASSATSAWPT